MKTQIRKLRKSCGYSQAELAEVIGKSVQAVSRYEVGNVEPNIATLIKLANLFSVTVDYLIKPDHDPVNQKIMKTRVRELRVHEKLTLKQLSYLIGVSPDLLSKYERDERGMDVDTLIKIADFFNVTIDYLVKRSDSNNVNFTKE